MASELPAGEPMPEEELMQEFEDEDLQEDIELDESLISELLSEDDEIEVNAENIADIVEELVVDTQPVKTGNLGTPDAWIDFAEELELARRQNTDYKEKLQTMHKAAKESIEERKQKIKIYYLRN